MKLISFEPNNLTPQKVFELAEKLNHGCYTRINKSYSDISRKYLGYNYIEWGFANEKKIILIEKLSKDKLINYYKELLHLYLTVSKK